MRETFSVDCAIIPALKRRKLFELDGLIFEDEVKWLDRMIHTVKSVVANQRAVLVICEDIATADKMYETLEDKVSENNLFLHYNDDGCQEGPRKKKLWKTDLNPGDVVITTNLGARGTDFKTNEIVNNEGGLFVLVTFIPLNDRVEKQAFGRTGRKGKMGSCQIIVNRKKMPKWLRLCETVEEAKRLRNEVNDRRLQISNEVEMMRNKQKLFDKYCELKSDFVRRNDVSNSEDVEIKKEMLDETWAKWIQAWEAKDQKSNNVDELHQHIETCSERAKHFTSENIYHLLKFGAVRMMKEEYERATAFFDQVIKQDRYWSAFAFYSKAYCTLQVKRNDYIKLAIDDLEEAHCKFEIYERTTLFPEIHGYVSAVENRLRNSKVNVNQKSAVNQAEKTRGILTQYQTMMECQLLLHVNTQITETIKKLKTINAKEWAGKTSQRGIFKFNTGS